MFSSSLIGVLLATAAYAAQLPRMPHEEVVSSNSSRIAGLLRDTGTGCCTKLEASFASITFFKGESLYDQRQTDFFDGSQRQLFPSCRVRPTDANQVSAIVKLAVANSCQFAVVSGGHASWDSSNIGPEGFNIDLSGLNALSLSADKKTVSIGPGNTFQDVYSFLDGSGLAMVGGRASSVGVGGFLLNGGVSFHSYELGWGASNINKYQIVVADGRILDVDSQTNADLFKALKFGSTNYGIVTRYDTVTVPLGDVWGGARYMPDTDAPALLQHLETFTINTLNNNPKVFTAVGLAYDGGQGIYLLWCPTLNRASTEAWPADLKALQSIGTPIIDTLRVTNLVDITTEIADTSVPGQRTYWWSLNIKASASLMQTLFDKGKQLFEPFQGNVNGIVWNMVAQPMPKSMFREADKRGGDYSGQSEANGDQWLLLGAGSWNLESDDGIMIKTLKDYLAFATAEATKQGKLIKFIYPNYASPDQDVLGSFGAANVAAMKAVKTKYDPAGTLPKLWKGGFRLK